MQTSNTQANMIFTVLTNTDNKVESLKGNKYFKAIKAAWYVGKGLLYLSSSLAGYEGASKLVGKIIDKIRGNKEHQKVDNVKTSETLATNDVFQEFAQINIAKSINKKPPN